LTQTRSSEIAQEFPLQIVGSTVFGRYPEISVEQTLNMLIADDALIPFAGYKYQKTLGTSGRGIYSSIKSDLLFAVYDNILFKINTSINQVIVGNLITSTGDVFISEDIINNIAVCDKVNIYIYNYVTGQFYIPGTAPYTGPLNATITQSGNIVTASSGTTFTSAMVGGTIYFGGNLSAKIISVTDSTHLTVNISQTLTSQGFLIQQPLDFIPNNITFQDGRFIATSIQTSATPSIEIGQWRLSDVRTVTANGVTTTYVTFPATPQKTGLFQTKADSPVAPVRFPGRGNLLLIMGSIVTEPWTDLGLAVFPYQKQTSYNIDYGTINPSTIAYLDNLVAWVGYNERSGLVIMYTTGQDIKSISTDGINYKLAHVNAPESCYAMSFKQDGHLIYMVTFYDPRDNFTFAYDFSSQKFFTMTDQNLNYHIAKRIVFFNDRYYFITINDGDLYEINSEYTTFQYRDVDGIPSIYDIPYQRITPTLSIPNGVPGVLNSSAFNFEQGVDSENTQESMKLASINIISGGSGYSQASILLEGDGVGAFAEPILLSGSIVGYNLLSYGVGYTWCYATVIGDGSGANLEPILTYIRVSPNERYFPRIALSMSYDGGHTFSSFMEKPINRSGDYLARNVFYDLGYGNKFTHQFRFYGRGRFVAMNGISSIFV